jgi:hypothetical protein
MSSRSRRTMSGLGRGPPWHWHGDRTSHGTDSEPGTARPRVRLPDANWQTPPGRGAGGSPSRRARRARRPPAGVRVCQCQPRWRHSDSESAAIADRVQAAGQPPQTAAGVPVPVYWQGQAGTGPRRPGPAACAAPAPGIRLSGRGAARPGQPPRASPGRHRRYSG